MSQAERQLFFKTLDLSGNGLLSWGELQVKYFKDHDTADTVFIYYIKRWRHMKQLEMGGGVQRVEGVDYHQYRIDYMTSIWGDELGLYGPGNTKSKYSRFSSYGSN